MNNTRFDHTESYFIVSHHFVPIALITCLLAIILIIPYWTIFGKAGLPKALALLMIIPVVNVILLYFLAFSRWKVIPAQNQL